METSEHKDIGPIYMNEQEKIAVEKFYDLRKVNQEKIAKWRATIPDEQYKAYMEADADRKRKKTAENMTEKQKENFEVKVQKA